MKTTNHRLRLILAILGLSLAGCNRQPAPTPPKIEVRVAAAADLKFALDEVIADFGKKHPEIKVTVTYGSSGNFFAQLSNKAPYDLYLSADIDYPRKLIDQGLAAKESEFAYAIGQIVIWVPNESTLDLDKDGISVLADPNVRKIAIANPRHAPYGRAAEAAMRKLGIYDRVQDRFVLGENIAQAAQFVETRSADVGIIALSLAVAPAMRDKGRYWIVPLDSYPRLVQGGVILSWAVNPDAAAKLKDFLISEDGQAILNRYGFLSPKE